MAMTVVSVWDIQKLVCQRFRITPHELLGKGKEHPVVKARHAAMYLCRQLTGCSSNELGRAFNRDHSSVLHGIDYIRRIMDAPVLPGERRLRLAIQSILSEFGGPLERGCQEASNMMSLPG